MSPVVVVVVMLVVGMVVVVPTLQCPFAHVSTILHTDTNKPVSVVMPVGSWIFRMHLEPLWARAAPLTFCMCVLPLSEVGSH